MKTLSEHNEKFENKFWEIERAKRKANILCNECGTEMIFVDDTILASIPPKRNVKCPNCGARGYKNGSN